MSSSLITSLLILLVNLKSCVTVWGFHSQHYKYSRFENDQRLRRGKDDGTCLFMGKLRSRQAELQRKMKLAKEQAREKQSSATASDLRLTDEEMKEQNDRKRFDDLLRSSSTSIAAANGDISDNYLTDAQEEETIDAYNRGAERIFEGDPASTEAFDELICMKTENVIGERGSNRLLPWTRGGANGSDCLVVLSDPREKSIEFRDTIKSLSLELPRDIFSKIVFISADTPAENRRAIKKINLSEEIRLFSDEKREWMQTYTALGEKRWSMTLFILAEGRVQRLVREFSQFSSSGVLKNALYTAEKRRL